MNIYNKIEFKEKRRELRKNSTVTERILWDKLRDNQLFDIKFKKQFGVGIYIIDFYCPKAKLAIEIDGSVHESKDAKEYDKIRDEYISSLGINTIRFKNDEILNNLDVVLNKIINL